MKFFGYDAEKQGCILVLDDVSMFASPDELRRIAGFLKACADEMQRDPPGDWGPRHLEDSEFPSVKRHQASW